MKRVRIEKVKGRREPRWPEVRPVDPRDVDVLRPRASRGMGKRNVTGQDVADPLARQIRSNATSACGLA
jgi:hypothetical protein